MVYCPSFPVMRTSTGMRAECDSGRNNDNGSGSGNVAGNSNDADDNDNATALMIVIPYGALTLRGDTHECLHFRV
eukprot:11174809-Heterocapsa_arctica.AAC.1